MIYNGKTLSISNAENHQFTSNFTHKPLPLKNIFHVSIIAKNLLSVS